MYPTISDGIVLTGFSTNSSFGNIFESGGNFVLANLNQPFRFGNLSAASLESIYSSLSPLLGLSNLSSPAVEALITAYGLTDYVAGVDPPQKVPYVDGYLTNSNIDANQYLFFLPGHFDTGILVAGESTKQPFAVGESLTLGSLAKTNAFAGPVLVFTGCKPHPRPNKLPSNQIIDKVRTANDLPYCGGDCLATGTSLPSIPAAAVASFPNVGPGNFTAYIQPETGHGLNAHYNATAGYAVVQEFIRSI